MICLSILPHSCRAMRNFHVRGRTGLWASLCNGKGLPSSGMHAPRWDFLIKPNWKVRSVLSSSGADPPHALFRYGCMFLDVVHPRFL